MIPPHAWLIPLGIFIALAVYFLSFLAAAWLVTAWSRRRDRRLGRVIGITLKAGDR